MKKFILAIALIATVSTSLVSCSADDSDLQNTPSADGLSQQNNTILPPLKA